MKKKPKNSNVVQLFPSHKKDGSIVKGTVKMIGELFLLDLGFAICIDKKGNFVLAYMCNACDAYHLVADLKYKVTMSSHTQTPIDFLTAMMPFVNKLVLEHMAEAGIIQSSDE